MAREGLTENLTSEPNLIDECKAMFTNVEEFQAEAEVGAAC